MTKLEQRLRKSKAFMALGVIVNIIWFTAFWAIVLK
jgi:hypothetical protein